MTTPARTGRRVLILEDEPLIAMLLVDILEGAGFTIAGPAYDVAQALTIVSDNNIDVAILDINLGAGATSAPVADELSKLGIPFIFATGYSSSKLRDVDTCRLMVSKPYNERELIAGLVAAVGAGNS